MYKLLTHTDLDGVSCAVLAKLAWGENVDVTFCHNPADVTQYLQKKYQEKIWLEYDMIYVTDLSFDADILRDCKIYKDILRLFDHHWMAVEPLRKCLASFNRGYRCMYGWREIKLCGCIKP